jgi:hypothetical protein
MDPADILTPKELAKRLKVQPSWIFEQTRKRAKTRSKRIPLPVIRLTPKVLRFSWTAVCAWLQQNKD